MLFKIESALNPKAFADIELDPNSEQQPQVTQGYLGQTDAVTFVFRGDMRRVMPQLFEIACRRVVGGEPRRTLAPGVYDAVADVGGQLVRLTIQEGATLSDVGIIQIPTANLVGGRGLSQTHTILFQRCNRLRYHQTNQIQVVQ